jgi:hypothetical protein
VLKPHTHRDRMRFPLIALMLVGANTIWRVSLVAGVVALGAAVVVTVGLVAFGKNTADPSTIPSTSWLFAAAALVPTISLTLITIRPIQNWAFPAILIVPAGLGVLWILIILPDSRVAGLTLSQWRGVAWSLVAMPFVGALMVLGFSESDMYLGASDGVSTVGRVLVLVLAALVISVLFYGLMQGPAESLMGRAAVPWVALVFASTLAASWAGLAFLLMFGLVLGALRTRFSSIWPGFIATIAVFMGLITS